MRVFIIGAAVESGKVPGADDERAQFIHTCRRLGGMLRAAGHTVVVCSPFEDSADLEVLRGVAEATAAGPAYVQIHFPGAPSIRQRLDEALGALDLGQPKRVAYPPPQGDTREARQYAWLLCQLSAMDESHVGIAVGGKLDGAANMLLLLAESRKRNILPVPFLGGAAQQAFYRRHYELEYLLGKDIEALHGADAVEHIVPLAERLASPGERPQQVSKAKPLQFFISYPWAKPEEADYVETLLRRWNQQVFRDEKDIAAGHELPVTIREAIYAADVFIALWSREYACSPYCFDELEIALSRRAEGSLSQLWILCVDDTRVVPPRARELANYRVRSRGELEGRILDLLKRVSGAPE